MEFFKGKIDSSLTETEINNFDKILDYTEEFNTDKIIVFGFDQQGFDNLKEKDHITNSIHL